MRKISVAVLGALALPTCFAADGPRWLLVDDPGAGVRVFTSARILPDNSASGPSAVSLLVEGLEPGESYAAAAPYAASCYVEAADSRAAEGGRALYFEASAKSVRIDLVAPGNGYGAAWATSSFSVLPVYSVAARAFLFSVLLGFFAAAALAGAAVSLLARPSGASPGYLSVACAAAALAAGAAAAAPLFSLSGAALPEDLLPRMASAAHAVAVAACFDALGRYGGTRAARAFRWAGLGAAAVSAAALGLSDLPAGAPGFFLSAAAVPAFAAAALVQRGRARSFAVLSAAAAACLALSAVLRDSVASSALSCAGTLPALVFFAWERLPRAAAAPESTLLPLSHSTESSALTRFVPREFLRILHRGSVEDLRLGDHAKRDMTIFFSDIRQFTNLSEGLTPEESFKFINSYLARIVPVVTDNGGFIDKYMGDAIMALFPDENGADAAVRAAVEMQRKIVEYNGHRANCGYRPLSMGIGLHTGTLMLGVVGVEDRMQSTVISDAVNLASRLESITKVFNVSLAISEETFKSLQDPGAYKYRFIGKVRVKGKTDPVAVFEIFDGIAEDLFERKMRANRFFEQGMLSYYQKEFAGAMFYFRKVLEILPDDGASMFYLDNCMTKARS